MFVDVPGIAAGGCHHSNGVRHRTRCWWGCRVVGQRSGGQPGQHGQHNACRTASPIFSARYGEPEICCSKESYPCRVDRCVVLLWSTVFAVHAGFPSQSPPGVTIDLSGPYRGARGLSEYLSDAMPVAAKPLRLGTRVFQLTSWCSTHQRGYIAVVASLWSTELCGDVPACCCMKTIFVGNSAVPRNTIAALTAYITAV